MYNWTDQFAKYSFVDIRFINEEQENRIITVATLSFTTSNR